MRTQRLLLALAVTLLVGPALAFDNCDSLFKDSRQLAEDARNTAIARAPVRYRNMADSIRVVVDVPAATLIPFATEQQGTKIVVLPLAFARMACQMSLATFLKIENIQPENFDHASQIAARCLDAGKPRPACLLAFANELATRYRSAFARLPAGDQNVAVSLFYSALWQIAQHEYAHHYLEHASRLGANQISRIDAEFEADLFAITNGVQAGDAVSAMYYFFDGLADIESFTQKLSTPDYESGSCRASNVDNITTFIGVIPLLLLDAASGGGFRLTRNSPAELRAAIGKHFNRAVPTLKPGSCGLVAKVALGGTFDELKRLSARMNADAELLFAKKEHLDNERASRLVRDLVTMTESFRYADGIASKSIAMVLRNWGLKGRGLTPLMGQVDRLLENKKVIANLQSEDYGRLLASQGLAILQERVDLPAQSRLDRSFSLLGDAVRYNPRQTEAWMNLAIIAFKRGDRAAAARYADNSAATHTSKDKQAHEATEFFARMMKSWSSDSVACRSGAAKYHPYEGL